MATAEEDRPAPLGGQDPEGEEKKTPNAETPSGSTDDAQEDSQLQDPDTEQTGDEDKARPGHSPVSDENKRSLPHTAETTTNLPTPLPSPAPLAIDTLRPTEVPTSAPDSFFGEQRTHDSPSLGPANEAIDGTGFDLATGLSSCAVSEAETDAPNSAVESSVDALPSDADVQEVAKPGSRRTSSIARRTRDRSGTKSSDQGGVRRLSASKIQELIASPNSLPVGTIREQPLSAGVTDIVTKPSMASQLGASLPLRALDKLENKSETLASSPWSRTISSDRPGFSSRASTTPVNHRKSNSHPAGGPPAFSRENSFQSSPRPMPLNLGSEGGSIHGPAEPLKSLAPESRNQKDTREQRDTREARDPSPIPPSFPIPPMSAATFLQLELAAQRPSPLYVRHSYASDIPYESSAVKVARLKNFFSLPWHLEFALVFGALACLDAWLWTLTILPLRFLLAVKVLVEWWGYVLAKEVRWLVEFVWEGLGRLWRRARFGRDTPKTSNPDSRRSSEAGTSRSPSRAREPPLEVSANGLNGTAGEALKRTESTRSKQSGIGLTLSELSRSRSRRGPYHHRRTKSTPSNLSSFHKADLLQFAVIIMSSIILTQLDASRMYHFIRAQSAVKLYMIYNLIEVADRLLSALGQDIFECLFSTETLSRNSLGRSKVLLPFGMFCGALVYNCAHAITLFYQVITLNVAVNSYSNALLTLLMSNQFVEIKSTVFKKFEKENLFQLTCADIVERFQIMVVLFIIGLRNLVEVGGLTVPGTNMELGDEGASSDKLPLDNASVLPSSFSIMPSWLGSADMLSPFLVVIISEIIVDSVKHAYINKFNNIKPNFYNRVLDILCKDYYTNAFVTPSLTRRLGLPLIPLSTLFIRSSFQTYRMFLAVHMPAPLPSSPQTSLSVESATATSTVMKAAIERFEHVIRHALGRSVYGIQDETASKARMTFTGTGKFSWFSLSTDDAISIATLVLVISIVWLVLLIVKLMLGMILLRYSRNRYARMKMAEHAIAVGKAEKESFDAKGKRVGGFGAVEVGDERRDWIYADDPEGLKKARERERKMEEKREKGGDGERDLGGVTRYEMVAKRIW